MSFDAKAVLASGQAIAQLDGLLSWQRGRRALQSLTFSRSNENEACQLQQDNEGLTFDATGKFKLNFACDLDC